MQTFHLYCCRKGKEEGNPFRGVIADLTIPGGMGGKEMVSRLTEIDPEIRVIVSSGYSNDQVLSDYRSFGFCGVISKPYLTEEVAEVLAEVFG